MAWNLPKIDLSFDSLSGRIENLRALTLRLQEQFGERDGGNSEEFESEVGRPSAFGSDYVGFYTNYRIVLLPGDVDDIAKKYASVVNSGEFGRHKHEFLYLICMLECRLQLLVEDLPIEVVSLGRDCLPRSVPTKWGVKPPRQLGELTMPFDLAIHPLKALSEILNGDFSDYFSADHLSFDGSRNYVVDAKRDIHWNHEVGGKWTNDDYMTFKDRYLRRIDNFRGAVGGKINKSTVFVIYDNEMPGENDDEYMNNVASYIAGRRSQPVGICYINSSGHQTGHLVKTREYQGVPIISFSVPVPYEWYLWFDHKHFTLPLGIQFELAILRCITDTLKHAK